MPYFHVAPACLCLQRDRPFHESLPRSRPKGVSGGENPRIDGAALLHVWRPMASKAEGPNRLRLWRCNGRPEEGAIAALRFDRRARGQAAMAPFFAPMEGLRPGERFPMMEEVFYLP